MKKFTFLSMALAVSIFGAGNASAQHITVTVGGNGMNGYTMDGGPARTAMISGPKDVCMDAAHNIYFVEKANFRIRKISNKGVLTTISGGGGSLLDGVPAVTAALNPNYMCIDGSGNLYVSTFNKVRKIDMTSGLITTVAGTDVAGYGGDGGLGSVALLNDPQGIAVDAAGNVYIADRLNNRIRKVTVATGTITTIAGTGVSGYSGDLGTADTATLNNPITVAVDLAGNVYFSDQEPTCPGFDYSAIRKIDAVTNIISTIAGPTGSYTFGVPATTALLGTITGLFIDNNTGKMYCNEMSCSCREMGGTSDTLNLVGGDFYTQGYSDYINSTSANMNVPYGLFVDNAGTVYVADSMNMRIRKLIQLTNTPSFAFGQGQTVDAVAGMSVSLDTTLSITDLDASQTETWTVVYPATHGSLIGFPATTTSVGPEYLDFPTGTSYLPNISYVGLDSFQVRVSDGLLNDIVTVYVNVGASSTTSVGTVAAPVVSVFPNPATNNLNIHSTGIINRVAISNVLGQVVYDHANNSGNVVADIATLPAGVYFVKVNGAEVTKFEKK